MPSVPDTFISVLSGAARPWTDGEVRYPLSFRTVGLSAALARFQAFQDPGGVRRRWRDRRGHNRPYPRVRAAAASQRWQRRGSETRRG
jgi:hypothetical protein